MYHLSLNLTSVKVSIVTNALDIKLSCLKSCHGLSNLTTTPSKYFSLIVPRWFEPSLTLNLTNCPICNDAYEPSFNSSLINLAITERSLDSPKLELIDSSVVTKSS